MANLSSPNSDLDAVRRRLRDYELSLDRAKRKRLGQFFTGARASSLLAALSVTGQERAVVDPMAGHGDLLDAVATRATLRGQHVALIGAEIDGPTATLAAERLRLCATHTADVLHSDAFAPGLWAGERGVAKFDLVIANPPYVRYQSHSAAREHASGTPTAKDVRAALRALACTVPDRDERRVWAALIDGYSGLADLSVPSWLLCALLVRPAGTLALVVPKTWMNREYAAIIQYLQLRFFEPLIIIEEHGVGWFEDALVPTTLVVSRRRMPPDAIVPLGSRDTRDATTALVAIRPSAGDSRSLVGRAFPGADPDAAFADWIRGTDASDSGLLTLRRIPESDQKEAVIRRSRHEPWFIAAGELSAARLRSSGLPAPTTPAALQNLCGPLRPVALTTLERLGYDVGQGLRTGCNPFFYVDAVPSESADLQTVRVNAALGGGLLPVPAELLHPVVRRQSDVPGFAVDPTQLLGRVLVLEGWASPEDATAGLKAIPDDLASYVRRAATTAIGPADRRVRIPDLSAVRTNDRPQPTSGTLFGRAGARRFWYTLPEFAARHRPVLAVPRVNAGTPFFFLNTRPPTLTDANFCTIYGHSESLPPLALLVLLNSTWARACAECIGTPMGGGALKFEATQLRELPLPLLSAEATSRLAEIGRRLTQMTRARGDDWLPAADAVVLRELFPHTEAIDSLRDGLTALVADRRDQRRRVTKEAVL